MPSLCELMIFLKDPLAFVICLVASKEFTGGSFVLTPPPPGFIVKKACLEFQREKCDSFLFGASVMENSLGTKIVPRDVWGPVHSVPIADLYKAM